MNAIPNWYVITGGPSSGKTTLIEALRHKGYKTTHEEARHYIDTQRINGRDIEEVRMNQLNFQHKVLNMQAQTERDLDPEKLTFLDRALPDSLAYYRYLGLTPDSKLLEILKSARYKKIFILELLPLHPDYARTEDVQAQQDIQRQLIQVYSERPDPVVMVPVMDVKSRAEFVLANL